MTLKTSLFNASLYEPEQFDDDPDLDDEGLYVVEEEYEEEGDENITESEPNDDDSS